MTFVRCVHIQSNTHTHKQINTIIKRYFSCEWMSECFDISGQFTVEWNIEQAQVFCFNQSNMYEAMMWTDSQKKTNNNNNNALSSCKYICARIIVSVRSTFTLFLLLLGVFLGSCAYANMSVWFDCDFVKTIATPILSCSLYLFFSQV